MKGLIYIFRTSGVEKLSPLLMISVASSFVMVLLLPAPALALALSTCALAFTDVSLPRQPRLMCATQKKLGVKLAKVPHLKLLFDMDRKQGGKLYHKIKLGAGAADCVRWLKCMNELKGYATHC